MTTLADEERWAPDASEPPRPTPIPAVEVATLGREGFTPDPASVPPQTVAANLPEPKRAAKLLAIWAGVLLLGTALVLYGLGPMFQQREQHRLMGSYRDAILRASNENTGLYGVEVPKKAPEPGAPVAILEIGRMKLQQVTVEGAGPAQTRVGPGHVPGTAAPGQPGNSVIVGRSHSFGKPFSDLSRLHKGDSILVSTTQGQSVYTVESAKHADLSKSSKVDEIYGATEDDRLTLVTSASAVPWNSGDAVVVVAKLQTVPFQRTPQNGRTSAQTGLKGDSGALASVVLALVLFGLVMAGALVVYRKFSLASAYVLTIAPAAAVTVIAAETLSRLLPAWM